MFGTATLSFADGVRTEVGDLFEIEAPEFGLRSGTGWRRHPAGRATTAWKSEPSEETAMAFRKAEWPRKLRSHEWYGGSSRDHIYHRSWMKNQGLPADLFDGRPSDRICNTWSELTALQRASA